MDTHYIAEYILRIGYEQTISMWKGSRVFRAGRWKKGYGVVIWAATPYNRPYGEAALEERVFAVTNGDLPAEAEHIATVLEEYAGVDDSVITWHVFELPQRKS
jgi:hypothetical protein